MSQKVIIPKSNWNSELLEYLNLDSTQLYYKSYLVKCLQNKLNFQYGRYEIDDELMNLFKSCNYNIWWKYMSKSSLEYAIRNFRNSSNSKTIYKMSFNENGNFVEGINLE